MEELNNEKSTEIEEAQSTVEPEEAQSKEETTKITTNAPTFNHDLAWTIVQFLLFNWITAGVSLVFVILANSAYINGDTEEYETKRKIARISRGIGWGIAAAIVLFVVVVFAIFFVLRATH